MYLEKLSACIQGRCSRADAAHFHVVSMIKSHDVDKTAISAIGGLAFLDFELRLVVCEDDDDFTAGDFVFATRRLV